MISQLANKSCYQGRRPLDLKKKYIVGCQKIGDLTLSVSRTFSERPANVTKAKSTHRRASVDFENFRVFLDHYELFKSDGLSMSGLSAAVYLPHGSGTSNYLWSQNNCSFTTWVVVWNEKYKYKIIGNGLPVIFRTIVSRLAPQHRIFNILFSMVNIESCQCLDKARASKSDLGNGLHVSTTML